MTEFDLFIQKAMEKNANRVKRIKIEIEGLGLVEFIRPTSNYMIKITSKMAKELEFEDQIKEFNEMLYIHCPILQKKEVREKLMVEYEVKNPFDLVIELFGVDEIGDIALKFMKKFGFNKESEEIKKNSGEEPTKKDSTGLDSISKEDIV